MRARHLLAILALPTLFVLFRLARPTISGLIPTSAHAVPPEIFGLLHFVTSPDESDRVITTPDTSDPAPIALGGPITPENPVEIAWYALGSTTKAPRPSGWDARLRVLQTHYPLVVFSKRAKRLLKAYDLSPTPKIIEVDLRSDAAHIKTLLTRLTGQSTFPNVILHGRSLGGSDDLVQLHEDGTLREILQQGGIQVGWSGEGMQF